MSKIERGLLGALRRPINPAAILIMAVYTCLWGFWIGNPFWTVFDTAQIYGFMSHFPELFWGCTAMASGLTMVRGARRREKNALSLGAFIGVIHWSLISIMYFMGNWRNTGGITSLMIAVYCAYVYLNVRLNADSLEN